MLNHLSGSKVQILIGVGRVIQNIFYANGLKEKNMFMIENIVPDGKINTIKLIYNTNKC